MAHLRDYQKSKLYRAEDVAFKAHPYWKEQEFESLEECKEFAREIVNTKHWIDNKGWKRIKLKSGAGCSNAFYRQSDKSITLPLWSRNKLVMIHEFAHYLTHKTMEDPVGHGSHFSGHYLLLVDEIMGEEFSHALMEQYEEHGVKYKL